MESTYFWPLFTYLDQRSLASCIVPVRLCVCTRACVGVCMSVSVCVHLISSYSGLLSQQSQILRSGRKLVLSYANES